MHLRLQKELGNKLAHERRGILHNEIEECKEEDDESHMPISCRGKPSFGGIGQD